MYYAETQDQKQKNQDVAWNWWVVRRLLWTKNGSGLGLISTRRAETILLGRTYQGPGHRTWNDIKQQKKKHHLRHAAEIKLTCKLISFFFLIDVLFSQKIFFLYYIVSQNLWLPQIWDFYLEGLLPRDFYV